uniref:Glutamate dehydrogenase n=1 Tax=Erythrolobus australicus TaxID=1077150 RepID=A0A7S1TMT9_9RHOD
MKTAVGAMMATRVFRVVARARVLASRTQRALSSGRGGDVDKLKPLQTAACQRVFESVLRRDGAQAEFVQAVHEVLDSISPVVEQRAAQLEPLVAALCEPERVIHFRVPWVDDSGTMRVNRGFRVQMNSAIGPYKGGLRFHPSVDLSVLKFLAFEQVLKNALTTLPMGGGKGGADFDPKGKSVGEVMRFCQAFMTELSRHIGSFTDVPAGDIGVGGREIGFLFGQYKRMRNEFSGVLTGKALSFGGSNIRPEATGYGVCYFLQEMLHASGAGGLQGKRCVISGSGNVAQYACEKATQLGAKVVTLSDSGGFIHDADGIDAEKLAFVKELKESRSARIAEYVDRFPKAKFTPRDHALDYNPLWSVPCEIALPCATQNELSANDAEHLVENGCMAVVEGANMPSTPGAVAVFQRARLSFAPGKAANAGGVACSGLEMSQNALRLSWTRDEVDARLHAIMRDIHANCAAVAKDYGRGGDYVFGANVAGFLKVADAMAAQGVV